MFHIYIYIYIERERERDIFYNFFEKMVLKKTEKTPIILFFFFFLSFSLKVSVDKSTLCPFTPKLIIDQKLYLR